MESLLKDRKFQKILTSFGFEILKYFISKKINFSIVCNIAKVKFEPKLPLEISTSFHQLTVFILAGYTFESLELDEKNLYFEAGFGAENLGSFVTVPLDCIVQILLPNNEDMRSDSCIYVNLLATFIQENRAEDEGISSSMKALLSNPKNRRLKR